jgi:NhaA family Na+:H+ antiporter
MLVPAGIYLALNAALGGSLEGWGVPVATDVAFALAIVAALGRRVPPQIRILLLAFAATDDMGGVLVIAIFYSAGVNWLALLIAAGLFLAVLFLAYYRVFGSYLVYMLLGVAFVLTLFHSGVHTTIAGVLLGLAVPARPSIGRKAFLERCSRLVEQCGAKARSDEDSDYSEQELHALGQIEELVKESQSPVERLQELLTPFVSYLVLPIFALANAGVQVGGGMLNQVVSSPIAWGVVAGLVAGKPVGIVGGGYLAFRLGLANLPSGLGWLSVIGIGLLAGIGFTVSLFIAQLAFSGQPHLQVAKISILAASAAATLAGTAFFFLAHPARHSN